MEKGWVTKDGRVGRVKKGKEFGGSATMRAEGEDFFSHLFVFLVRDVVVAVVVELTRLQEDKVAVFPRAVDLAHLFHPALLHLPSWIGRGAMRWVMVSAR
jgi:hypothetical protein